MLWVWIDQSAGRILFGMLCFYVLIFTAAAIYKFETYQTGYDQIYFEQALWNTIEGRFMQQSDFNYATTAFTVDFMPGLLLFVPLYWLLPSPYTLFFIETLILALGALPVFWLARDKLKSRPLGLAFVLVYLANPTLQYFNLLPFNMRAMGLVCLLYAFYFFEKQRWWPFVLFALLAMSTRTEVSLIVAMFGFYGLLKRRPLRFWLPPLTIGLLYFGLVFSIILPSFIQPGQMVVPPEVQPVTLTQAQKDYIANSETIVATTYGDLGKNLPDVIKNTITNPVKTAERIFTLRKGQWLFLMLLPFAFLPLFSLGLLLFTLPIIGINLLSSRATQFDYQSHYSALLLFGLTVAAIYGTANLSQWLQRFQRRGTEEQRNADKPKSKIQNLKLVVSLGFGGEKTIVTVLLITVLAVQILMRNPLPGALRNAESKNMVAPTNALLNRIPRNASVSSTSFLALHLMPRQYSYLFPLALYNPPPEAVQYFVIDTNARALYLKENGKMFSDKLPIDFLEQDGRWKLVGSVTVKDNKGNIQNDAYRGKPRQIQVWQLISPNTPPLLPPIT